MQVDRSYQIVDKRDTYLRFMDADSTFSCMNSFEKIRRISNDPPLAKDFF